MWGASKLLESYAEESVKKLSKYYLHSKVIDFGINVFNHSDLERLANSL